MASMLRNLAKQMPAKVKELDGLIEGFLADTGALYPRPNPAYRPGAAAGSDTATAAAKKKKKAAAN